MKMFMGKKFQPRFSSMRKQPTFCDTTTGFLGKWSKFLANQKHYPDLGSVTSAVWNFVLISPGLEVNYLVHLQSFASKSFLY